MKNNAFRNLVSNTPLSATSSKSEVRSQPQDGKTMLSSLGSRARSSIPMTPRNLPGGYNVSRDFARQLAERNSAGGEDGPPLKKFKSSAAPKGTKLGNGYVDRASLLRKTEDGENTAERDADDREKRLKALEDMVKLQQIDQATFEKLRSEIGIGGDLGSTHLVKGLDRKLLERIRRGEDVSKAADATTEVEHDASKQADVDDELEEVLGKEVVAKQRIEQSKEDSLQDMNETGAQEYLSRDEILKRLKAGRSKTGGAAGSVQAPPAVLNDKFKKVAVSDKPGKRKFVESINGRRREVLLITNKDGTTKRKTRWLDPESNNKTAAQPMGLEVPAEFAAKQQALAQQAADEEEDDDIFQGVGAHYDPLADIESDSESATKSNVVEGQSAPSSKAGGEDKRNYFNTGPLLEEDNVPELGPIARDPSILAALKRAAQLRQQENGASGGDEDNEQSAKQKDFLRKLKERDRQDAADLDYGFGESRFGDEDDEDDGAVWEEGDEAKPGGNKRKRGPKKRKGDKNNAADVMNVLEGRSKN